MPDFNTAEPLDIINYMLSQGFNYEQDPISDGSWYIAFTDTEERVRYSNMGHPDRFDYSRTLRKTAVYALWRQAECTNTIDLELQKYEGFWYADSSALATSGNTIAT